ncbi:hypothetical protein THASP1DRAFT_29830 [Thamnocephalis sphaerospora]|uniref:Uncharacterized protein n=1 Tax=Thamnocephalis sphaerospora TaxID=78915 RepID=A0A4P9XQP5_9FUNG|nr:hypothetical protein THASP1DRAFT_29830 [Thamnocephalis sphaerospora]|eukprot:RKP08373.1 hypothetical protein THASP1DRAFT_29830 [Thamnocephalis sphaerospora]
MVGHPTDKLQTVELEDFYSVMYPIKWYQGPGYYHAFTTDAEAMQPSGLQSDGTMTLRLVGLLCLLTFVVTVSVLVGIYTGYLKDAVFNEGRRAATKEAKKE